MKPSATVSMILAVLCLSLSPLPLRGQQPAFELAPKGIELLKVLTGHKGFVTSAAFSPDGTLLATAGSENVGGRPGEAFLWGVEPPRLSRRLPSHKVGTVAVSFSSDGRMLATADRGGAIKIWNPRSGEEVRTLQDPDRFSQTIALSGNGEVLVSAGGKRSLRFWDAKSGDVRLKVADPEVGSNDLAPALSVSPDGKLLAIGGSNGVALRDLRTGKRLAHEPWESERTIYSLAFSRDGTLLAAGTDAHHVLLWRVQKDQLMFRRMLVGHAALVDAVAFLPDGRTLVTGGKDHTIRESLLVFALQSRLERRCW